MLGRLAALMSRCALATTHSTPLSLGRLINLEPSALSPLWTQVRTFKDKEVLKIRCPNCYFKKLDNRWWVLCSVHPRHKQRQKIDDIRRKWIVTHHTRTGPPFRKHFQYPGHDL